MLVIRHKLFQCVVDHTQQKLIQQGVDASAAKEIAESVADRLAWTFGGQNICFPKDASRMRRERDAQMLVEFNGHNYLELAERFGMTERSVRRILEKLRLSMREPHKKLQQEQASNFGFAQPSLS